MEKTPRNFVHRSVHARWDVIIIIVGNGDYFITRTDTFGNNEQKTRDRIRGHVVGYERLYYTE